ncbi:MAG TPA: DUF4340 domain-containing protein [Stellaceae bacterium]|nr:DUF4340 domain-containing protein [Stellaceae bacterium]
MSSKGLIGLVIATAAALVVAILLAVRGGSSSSDPQSGAAVLPELTQRGNDIARLTLVHGPSKTTLMRKGDQWVVEEKSGYPADPTKVRQALLGLAELRYVEAKTRKPDLYPRIEVEDAGQKDAKSTLVTASTEKGDLLGEIIAGKHRIDQLGGGVDGIYVRKPGDLQSWLARGTLDLPGDTLGWLDRKLIDLPQDKLKEAVLTQADGSKVDLARDKPEAPLALKGAPANAKLKEGATSEPASVLAGLEFADVRPAADVTFPSAGVAHAEYTDFDGRTIKLTLVEQDGKSWAHIEASGSGDAEKPASDLNAKLAPWVYALPDYKAKALKTKLSDLVATPKGS